MILVTEFGVDLAVARTASAAHCRDGRSSRQFNFKFVLECFAKCFAIEFVKQRLKRRTKHKLIDRESCPTSKSLG